MKLSSSALFALRLGWLIGASVSLALNGNFGYTLSLSFAQGNIYLLGFGVTVLCCLDIFKNFAGSIFARVLQARNKLKVCFALALFLVIYSGLVGVSASSTSLFFTDKAKAEQTSSPQHKAKLEEIEGLEKTYKADERTYDNIVTRNNERRAKNIAPLEKEEVQKKDAMDASRAKLKQARDEYNNLPAGEQSWLAKFGESFGNIFTAGLELFIFFCSFAIALIKEDEAAKAAQDEIEVEQETETLEQSGTQDTCNSAPVPPVSGTNTAQEIEEVEQVGTKTDTRILISKEDLIVLLEKEIVPMSARAICEKYQFTTGTAQRIINKVRKAQAQEQEQANNILEESTSKNDIPTSNIILLPTTMTK